MVVECPICSKVLNNEQFCPYCGTNINEEISDDFTSFQKLKNLFSSAFGKGLSKKDKEDFDDFLSNNESKIADFIKTYQNPFEKLVLDISAIKQNNKSVYNVLCKITNYFEEKKFNLSINQRKLCYTFKRIYEELDDIIAKNNKEYSINTYDNVKIDMEKLNDFFSPQIPEEYISKDKLSYKNQFKSSYDLIKPVKDYIDSNSNILSKSQKETISNFISNFDNFDNIIQKINYQIWFSNNLDDINNFLAIKSKTIDSYISDDKKDGLKAPEECYNKVKQIVDFHNNVLSLDIDLNIVHDFIKDYDNYDNIIIKLNVEFFIRDNFEIIQWVIALNKVKPFYFIDNDEKEKYSNSIQKIYSDLTRIKQYYVKDSSLGEDNIELINTAIKNYDNVDELVIQWNENYYLYGYVKKFARIGEYAPNHYFSNNLKQDLFKWYENVLPNVKKFKKDFGKYISPNDEKLFEKFFNKAKTFEKDTKKANELYINQELNNNSDLFDDLDGKSLDNQQRNAIVIDEDAVRVIAGAGSGKTLTIQGKVKYLTKKRNVDPSEILAISFSNASVNDLKERIVEPIDIKTFHKVGKDILTHYNQYSKPDEFALDNIIKRYLIKKAFKDNKISKKLIEFFSFYINIPPSDDDDVKYVGDLLKWQEDVDFSTLKRKFKNKARETLNNEIVRSYEELYIANFLFIHQIDYTYEKIYTYVNKNFDSEFNKFKNLLFSFDLDIPEELKNNITKSLLELTDISKEHEIKNYAPDFYLNDYDIYIEHFGLNRNCENHLIGKKSSKEYVNERNWKKKVHKKYGTTLIETFSYYQSENRLVTRLTEKLDAQGVKFGEIDYVHVYKKLLENRTIKEWKDFIKLLKTFISLFKGNNYDENKFKEFYDHANNDMVGFSKERSIAFLEIVEEVYNDYEAYLLEMKKIDFNDMINKASDCIIKYGLDLPYKYIIVDEYQDTSFTRYNLLKKIHDAIGAKIMIVGDDWQSIYSFTGCDVNIFTKFDSFFDVCETCFIETTYRNSQQLINATSNFVMKNPEQTKKNLKSFKSLDSPIKIVKFTDDSDEILKLEWIIKNIIKKSKFKNIMILGRNNNDIFDLLHNSKVKDEDITKKFDILGNKDKLKREKFLRIRYNDNPNINIEYRTVHQSKGLESDNVILINLKNKNAGFPNNMVDDKVLNFVKRNLDSFDHAEERRLFYVALTRTKNNVYLLAPHFKSSIFVEELEGDVNVELFDFGDYNDNLKDGVYITPTKLNCPDCKSGKVLLKSIRKNGKIYRFFECSNNQSYPYNRCSWKGGYYSSRIEDLNAIEHCPNCDGILITRYRRSDNHPFLGCTNFSKTGCRGKTKKFSKTRGKRKTKKLEYIGKNCPECGKPLVKRVNGDSNRSFIGCSGFPKCRYTEQLF